METLVKADGSIDFGLYDVPVGRVNYLDYALETPLGLRVPTLLKKLKFNQFLFLGVVGPKFILGMAIVDLKFISNGFFYIFDRDNKEFTETKKLAPSTKNAYIEPYPDKVSGHFRSRGLTIEMSNGKISARGKDIAFDAELNLKDINPLRVCSRAGYRGWTFKQGTTSLKLQGELTLKGESFEISSPSYMGLLDWTGGYMRRKTFWNWAAISSALPDGRSLGLNLSCGVNETSFTENMFLIDNKVTKVDTVNFVFDPRDLGKDWRISSYDGKVDLVFRPESQRSEMINALFIASRFTQMMGTFKGTLKTDDGETLKIDSCPGWAEDHFAKW